MKSIALSLLFALPASGADPVEMPSDTPLMIEVESGTVSPIGEPNVFIGVPHGYFVNALGYQKLGEAVIGMQERIHALEVDKAALSAENRHLQETVDATVGQPRFNAKTVAIIAIGALGLGVAGTLFLTH